MLASALDNRQQELLMTLKRTITEENKINEIVTKDKVHSNEVKSREISTNTMYDKNKYNDLQWGEVLYVDLDQNGVNSVGSEQKGIRYAIVIQNDIGNKFSPTIIVALVTSQINKAKLPLVHVEIPAENFGLPKDSVVLLEQIRTLDKRRIIKRVGKVDEITSLKIEKAMQASTARKLEQKTPLERLPQNIQDLINDKLEDIKSIERTIYTIVNNDEYLRKNLYGQRECYLASLERICKKYNINYTDYYIMYKKEKEDERVVV